MFIYFIIYLESKVPKIPIIIALNLDPQSALNSKIKTNAPAYSFQEKV